MTTKKMTVKYLLQHLFDLKLGKRKTVTLYNEDGTATATLGSEGEGVFGNITRKDADCVTMCNFDDCLFYMTQEEIFYKEVK